ncbi:MAG: hypothetical protein AB7S78_02620 [Candidatus Omnitrophota bacterium]
MEMTLKEKLVSWLVTTGISLALFLVGLFGQIGINSSPVIKISKERIQLKSDIRKLTAESFNILKNRSFLNPESQEGAARLESDLEKLKAELAQLPTGDEGKTARNKTGNRISETEAELLSLKESAIKDFLSNASGSQIPPSISDFQNKTIRLTEIGNMGWAYSQKTSVALFLLGFLCNLTMCAGMLGLFLFGILGLFTFIGSIK